MLEGYNYAEAEGFSKVTDEELATYTDPNAPHNQEARALFQDFAEFTGRQVTDSEVVLETNEAQNSPDDDDRQGGSLAYLIPWTPSDSSGEAKNMPAGDPSDPRDWAPELSTQRAA